MKKKLLSLALALVMCLGLTVPAFAAERVSEFTDIPEGAWYLDELDYAVYNAWLSGVGGNKVDPDGTITRGQFVTIMGRMFDAPTDGGKTAFEDVPENAFYAPYVAWASSRKIVSGYSSTEFGPENSISVEQMGTIFANYLNKEEVVLTESPVMYADESSISAWAKPAMAQVAKYDLIPTDASGNVNPQKTVSRAEAAVALVRLAKALNLGVVPPASESPANATEIEAKRIHDELWASGKLTVSMTEKEKAIVYYDWMCMNCWYGSGKSDGLEETLSHTAYGALVNRIAACDGLSYGYKALLETEGIVCECIPYPLKNHMNAKAFLDGVWYEINLANCVSYSREPDGTYSESQAEMWRDKSFLSDQEFKAKYFGT